MSSFPVLRTRLSVCSLSPFPDSLPQLFLRCLPFAFAFGLSPLFRFLSSASVSVLTTQPSALSFPFFPFSPVGGSFGAASLPFGFLASPLPSGLFPCLPSDSGTRLPVRFLSSLPVSLPQLFHRCFPSVPLSLVRFSSGLSPHVRSLSFADPRF